MWAIKISFLKNVKDTNFEPFKVKFGDLDADMSYLIGNCIY
jgi:hypothetical protein